MHDRARFLVDPLKCFAGAATFVVLAVVAVVLVVMGEYLSAAIFFAVGVLFIPETLPYAGIVSIDATGVHCARLGRAPLSLAWSDVAEVGAAGSRVFRHGKESSPGRIYFYFSPVEMTDDDRFNMMFRFPPKDKVVLRSSDAARRALRQYWSGPVQEYQTGKRGFGEHR